MSHTGPDSAGEMLTEQEAASVHEWLERNQFERISSSGDESTAFGDRQGIWERERTLLRLTRDRGQWWYDISRRDHGVWLGVDGAAGALGAKTVSPVERVAAVASVDDRVFGALVTIVRRAP